MPTAPDTNHRWLAGLALAVLLQAVAFGYWAGTVTERVATLTRTVDALRADVNHLIRGQ